MKTNPESRSQLNRRQFLKATACSTSAFMVLPAGVVGLRAGTSPNGKLNLAGIGIGGQGASDLGNLESENIVALCDVDQNHAGHVFKKYPRARQFTDYRKMLEEMKEIDGVVVATPDHLHAFVSMEAIRHGKHVYCEKPLTHSVWEARHLAQAAHEAGVVTQMGNQGQASRETRHMCELAWSGVIGRVHEAHVWTDRPSNGLFGEYWPQGVPRPKDTPPVPATLDWDLWLGPARERPYNPAYLPFKWRGWWDFGTGALGDIGCHSMDPIFRALKLGAPITVQASSTRVNEETFPLGSMVTYQFPERSDAVQANNNHLEGMSGPAAGAIAMPPCKLIWYDGGLRPPRPDLLPEGQKMGDNGKMLVGEKGFILSNSSNQVFPESCAKDAQEVRPQIPDSPGHHKEWIAACKGGKKPGSNFDWAGPLAEAVLLGNVALRVQLREDLTLYRLKWDSKQLKFTNLEEANKFVRTEYRSGWTL